MNIVEKYINSRNEILNHVGIKFLSHSFPLIDKTKYFWKINEYSIMLVDYESIENIDDNVFNDLIEVGGLKYPIYRGEQYSLVCTGDSLDYDSYIVIIVDNNKEVIE